MHVKSARAWIAPDCVCWRQSGDICQSAFVFFLLELMLSLAFSLLFMTFQLVAGFFSFHQVDQVALGLSISTRFRMIPSCKRFTNSVWSDFTV